MAAGLATVVRVEDPTTPWVIAEMRLPATWAWLSLLAGVAAVLVGGFLIMLT